MALSLDHNGRTYEWDRGNWVDTARNMIAPEAIRSELNAAFIRYVEQSDLVNILTKSGERPNLFAFLREQMGASLERLTSLGFFNEVLEANPEAALTNLYSGSTTPSGRSFVNCERLRDRFFMNREVEEFELPVKLLGVGPFNQPDLKAFLRKCRTPLWKRNTPVHALVLGREDWKPEDIDKIVEEAEGAVLLIYSQELILSVLAGFPDPFRTWPLTERLWDLYAFRQGHPGLLYVSNGWDGWIRGVGSSAPITWSDGSSDFGQVEQSPLSVLGYRVGVSGLDEESRRQILRAAFDGPLPFVESAVYMEAWGATNTAKRLKRIADHLASTIDTHRNRANHQTAVSDWQADLVWLKETFYRGVHKFYWPQS
jgi:hypothetical protein